MSVVGTERTGGSASEEHERLAAVRSYEILDTPSDGAFDRVAALAARMFEVPIATVTIVDQDRIWFKACRGLPEGLSEISRDLGLCASAIFQDEPYVLPDTLRDPVALDNPLVRGELGIRFYAAAPIITADGHRFGTVNVLDTKPREATKENITVLRTLAAVVAEQLELHLAALDTVSRQETNLRTALESRTHTDHAVGMIMMARHCDADTAWSALRQTSQGANIKVRVLAETMDEILAGTDPATLDWAASGAALTLLTPRHDWGSSTAGVTATARFVNSAVPPAPRPPR